MDKIPYDDLIKTLDNVRDTLAAARRAHPRLAVDRTSLAKASGLSYATVRKMERDCAVTLESIVAYAYALGKRVRIELVDLEDELACANAGAPDDDDDDWDDGD